MRRAITLLLLCVGCSREAAPGQVQASPGEPDGPDPIEPTACGGRPGCRVETRLVLNRRRDGRELVVVVAKLASHEESATDGIVAGRAPEPGEFMRCTPFETSLISRTGGTAERVQSLVTDCLLDRPRHHRSSRSARTGYCGTRSPRV